MRLIVLASLTTLLITANIAEAQIEDLRQGPIPTWVKTSPLRSVPNNALGLAFLRQNDQFTHLHEGGQVTFQGQRIKLLDPRALEAGNLSISWNPAAGEPTVHKLLIHRDGEIINVLEKSKFEILRREQQLEQSILNGFLTAVLRVPDLRIGDELEWAYSVPSKDPTLGNDSFGLMAFSAAPLAGRHALGVSWENGQKPTIKIPNALANFENRTSNSIEIELDDPKMVEPTKFAPPRYSWGRVIEYSDYSSWNAISQKFHKFFSTATIIPSDSNIREEAARISNTRSTKLEQLNAALELVQQQVRYIYIGLEGGNFKPATAEETWDRRYGDCKGKSVLLMALLRELNIKAEFVLANNKGIDDGFDERLPNPALFDHILIRAEIDGKRYWLDPTLPSVIEPSPKPFIPYRWVLPLSNNGHILEAIEQKPFELPQEMGLVEIDARAGFEQPARKVQKNVLRGIAGLGEYMQYSAYSAEQLKSALSNAFNGGRNWDKIEDVAYRYDRETQASVLTITGTGPVDWENKENGRYELTLPGGGFSPPSRMQRAGDQDKDIPYYNSPSYSCHVTTVRLPDQTDLNNWGYNSTYRVEYFGRLYFRMMDRRDDHTIRMVRASRRENFEITAAHVEQDTMRIDDFDNSMARIIYVPGRVMGKQQFQSSVPATYEVDWTDSDAPCIPGIKSHEHLNSEAPIAIDIHGDEIYSGILQRQTLLAESRTRYENDARMGDSEAQYQLAISILYASEGDREASNEAFDWLEKAADQGHKKANLELGRRYAIEGIELKKAVEHFKLSEDREEGAFGLAQIYFNISDQFPDVSDEQILELYHISAENDYTDAQRELAERYREGSIVKRDDVEALKWVIIAYGFEAPDIDRFKNRLSNDNVREAREKAEEWILKYRKNK